MVLRDFCHRNGWTSNCSLTISNRVMLPEEAFKLRTILLVEDERSLTALLELALVSWGYAVLTCCDGAEALAVLQTHAGRIDLLLSDIVLPKLDGAALATEVCRLSPSTRVLLISGYSESLLQSASERRLSWPLIQKPFRLDEVRDLVAKVLANPRTESSYNAWPSTDPDMRTMAIEYFCMRLGVLEGDLMKLQTPEKRAMMDEEHYLGACRALEQGIAEVLRALARVDNTESTVLRAHTAGM